MVTPGDSEGEPKTCPSPLPEASVRLADAHFGLCPRRPLACSLFVSNLPPPFSLRTAVIGFRAHPDPSMRTAADPLLHGPRFLNRAVFTSSRFSVYLLGAIAQPITMVTGNQ